VWLSGGGVVSCGSLCCLPTGATTDPTAGSFVNCRLMHVGGGFVAAARG